MSDDKLGYECQLYYDATRLGAVGGLSSSESAVDGSWTELTLVKDLAVPLTKAEADVTTRKNAGWKATRGGLKDGGITFDLLWDPTDADEGAGAGVTAVREAFINNTLIPLAVMDGDIASNDQEGFVANFEITGFERAEPLEESVTIAVTAKPRSNHEWYKVGA